MGGAAAAGNVAARQHPSNSNRDNRGPPLLKTSAFDGKSIVCHDSAVASSYRRKLARRLLRGGRGVVAAMLTLSTSPFWNRKLRLAILTLATFAALC